MSEELKTHAPAPWRINEPNPKAPRQIVAADGSVVAKLTALDMQNAEHIVFCVNAKHESAQAETDHLLSNPANAAHLARSIEQARNGQVQERQLVEVEDAALAAAPSAAPDTLIARLREHDDPRLYHEADVLMSEAADRIAELEQDLDVTLELLEQEHARKKEWQERACDAAPSAAPPDLRIDVLTHERAMRFQWLCADHDSPRDRAVRDDILRRMPMMSLSAACQAIDYAMCGEYHLPGEYPAAVAPLQISPSSDAGAVTTPQSGGA